MQRLKLRMCRMVAFGLVALTAVVSAKASYISTVEGDSPSGYWRFDETSGATATNLISSLSGSYTGTCTLGQTGALTASGDTDAALGLNGNGNVVIPNSAINGIGTGAFSVELWFNTTAASVRTDILTFKNTGGGIGLFNNSGTLELYVDGGAHLGNAVVANTWYDVVITRDSSHTMTLYVNGSSVTSFTTTNDLSTYTYGLWVGSNHDNNSVRTFGFCGAIDDMSLYTYALSASQVAAHYAAAVAVPEPSAAALIGVGLFSLLAYAWRKRRR